MMKVLIIAEHNNNILKPATYHAVTAAKQLGKEIDLLVVGFDCQQVADEAAAINMQKVLVADDIAYEHQLPENVAMLAARLGKHYDYILAGATTFGKNLLPRVAALLDVAMLSDVTQIVTPDTFVRPMHAGNILATIQSKDVIKILTIRTTAFPVSKEKN